MIFNDDMIFIHIPKTGGISCATFLLNNLKPPIYNCHKEVEQEMQRKLKRKLAGIVPVKEIGRHCTLTEALKLIRSINGKRLKDFKKVVAVIRHPYDLEQSFYFHLRKPAVQERRSGTAKGRRIVSLAQGPFEDFVKSASHLRGKVTQDQYVSLNGKIPGKVAFVKFENLAEQFQDSVRPFLKKDWSYPFPHKNESKERSDKPIELTPQIKAQIYRKHRSVFDHGLYVR